MYQKINPRFVSAFALTPLVLLFLSSVLYFLPYLVGSFDFVDVDGRRFRFTYHSETGYAIVLALISIVAAIFILPTRGQNFIVDQDSKHESLAILGLLAVFGGLTLATPELYMASKSDVLESTGRIQFVFYNTCIIGVIFSILSGWKRHRITFIVSCLGLLFTLFIGHRSSVAIALVSSAYVMYRNTSIMTIKKRYIFLILLSLAFLAVYKSVYVAVKTGNYTLLSERLQVERLSDSALVGLEQFVIFAHLDLVVNYDYSLMCSNLWLVPFSIIPFLDSIFGESSCGFNEQVQPFFFPGYRGGVAANIWAEFYANFGYLGLPLLVAVLSLIYAGVEAAIRNVRSAALKAGLIVSIVHLALYIQRKELLGAFISAKRAILVALIVFCIGYALRHLFPSPQHRAWRSRPARESQALR